MSVTSIGNIAIGSFSSSQAALKAEIPRKLPELVELERVIRALGSFARVEIETVVHKYGVDFPIYSIVIGSEDRSHPTLGVLGGVHGLERIGSDVSISWLKTLAEVLTWDRSLQERLRTSRLCLMPIVNPIGIYQTTRANGNGVDLMRNAPVEAEEKALFLVGGHRLGPLLPWYRGTSQNEDEMEAEAKAVLRFVRREMFPSRASLVVDVHSGFGSQDRLWFPYAKSRKPPEHLAEISAIKRLFDRSYPNHFYRIEPQSKNYVTHGDIWDYLYIEANRTRLERIFIPWTLELGSWLWLKKNPRQLFSSLGPFNPLQPHRLQRILRRHLTLFDFLHRAVSSHESWSELTQESRQSLSSSAMDLWYEEKNLA